MGNNLVVDVIKLRCLTIRRSFMTLTGKLIVLITLFYFASNNTSFGLPSYARQTGMSCEACHNSFPELTSFGRQFKLNGYTMTGMSTIEDKSDSGEVRLKLLSTLPISAMAEASLTHLSKEQSGTQNNNVDFPQQLSIFYAGQITPHIGTFIQITYSAADGSFVMDNTDIRYSNQTSLFTKSLQYGLTLNNNPTVQDIWNTLPAWGYRYASSGVAPGPGKATLLEGGLAGSVAGLGAYVLFNNWIYGELSAYRSAQQGSHNPPDSTNAGIISGFAPYGRIALQHQMSSDYIEIGAFGLAANMYRTGISGLTDNSLDIGFDLQYEHIFDFGTLTLHSSLINESQKFNATSNVDTFPNNSYKTNSFKVDANMFLKKRVGGTIGYFSVSGDKNDVYYNKELGNINGIPNSNGIIAQLDYLPWYNTKFSVQYIMYNKFDGMAKNYDGSGRNAADNNTIYVLMWLNF